MPISALCSSCGHRFLAPDSFGGKRVKCKHCGEIFQIPGVVPESPAGEDEVGFDALSELESSGTASGAPFGGGETRTPGRSRPGQRVSTAKSPRTASTDPGEETVDAPAAQFARANLLTFNYPGARLVDQWLSTVLLVGSLGWLMVVESGDTRDNPGGVAWIKAVRFFVPVLLYVVAIYPITLMLVRKSARTLRYRLPPAPQFRVFAAYLPALTLAVVLWTVGDGAIVDLLIGTVFGLVLSSALLWVLYRLREHEIGLTVGYGAGGFAIGAAITAAVIFTANTAARLAVARDPAANVPASPLGPGLAWIAPPPPKPEPLAPRLRNGSSTATPALASGPGAAATIATPPPVLGPPPPACPLLSSLQPDPIPGPLNNIVSALSDAPYVAVVQTSAGVDTITDWSLSTGATLPKPVRLSGQMGTPVLSNDGQSLASIATFPRRSVWLTSFQTGKTLSKTDLDPKLQGPGLVGFLDADRILLRSQGDRLDVLPLGQGGKAVDPQSVKLPPLENQGTTLIVDTAGMRLGLATKIDGVPTFMQYNLSDTAATPVAFPINIDRSLPVAPLGLAYSADGKRIGLLFEQQGNVALLCYDADTGANPSEFDFPAPVGIPGVSHDDFKGNGLVSVDPAVWVVEGQVALNASTGEVIAPLGVDHVISARPVSEHRLALMTAGGGGQHVTLATFDPAKLQQLAPPATQPATAPAAPAAAPPTSPSAIP